MVPRAAAVSATVQRAPRTLGPALPPSLLEARTAAEVLKLWESVELGARGARRVGETGGNAAVLYLLRLGQLRRSAAPRIFVASDTFDRLLVAVSDRCAPPHVCAADVTGALVAAAYLHMRHPGLHPLVQRGAEALSERLSDIRPEHLVDSYWALARARVSAPSMLRHRLRAEVESLGDVALADITRLAWACAPLPVCDTRIVSVLAKFACARLGGEEVTARVVANLFWAAARLEASDERMLHAVVRDAVLVVSELTPQGLANVSWALATLSSSAAAGSPLCGALAAHATRRIDALKSQELTSTAWGFARLRTCVANAGFCAALTDSMCARVPTLAPRDLVGLAWAVTSLDACRQGLHPVIAQTAPARLHEFRPPDVAGLAWVFAKGCRSGAEEEANDAIVPVPETNWGTRVENIGRASGVGAEFVFKACAESAAHLDDFCPRALANLTWAAAVMVAGDKPFLVAVAGATALALDRLGPQDIANLAWSFGRFAAKDAQLLTALAQCAFARAQELEPRALSGIAWALAIANTGNVDSSTALACAALPRLRSFEPRALANLAWAVARLREGGAGLPRALAEATLAQMRDFAPRAFVNVLWALATLGGGADGDSSQTIAELCEAVSTQMEREGLPNVESRILANLAWAFVALSWDSKGFLHSAAKEMGARLRVVPLPAPQCGEFARVAKDSLAVVWALRFAGLTNECQALVTIAAPVFARLGAALDRVKSSLAAAPKRKVLGKSEHHKKAKQAECDVPRVVSELPDRLVLQKPAGWEVDQHDDKEDRSGDGGRRLSVFFRSLAMHDVWPVAWDAGHGHGFPHRLDVPSSGLVLAAKSYEAYYDLLLQLNAGAIMRDYVVLCHGHIPPQVCDIVAHVDWAEGSGRPSSVGGFGRPSRTMLKVLAHADAAWDGTPATLAAVRIDTGRRHQIRAHFAHIGHPIVCDGKYTTAAVFLSDLQWCQRNFLHRYRLAFTDAAGEPCEASAPLPMDLREALRHVRPHEDAGRSSSALRTWLDGARPSAWHDCPTLGQAV